MTINNPTENDYVLVRNPNDKYIRQLVWTPEEGEEKGTPHIQAWIRLQRNQTYAMMRKLFPRGVFKHCEKPEYNENVHQYAQKNDVTTRGAHVISLNDPLPSIERLITEVIERSFENLCKEAPYSGRQDYGLRAIKYRDIFAECAHVEKDLVREKGPMYARVFVSPVYARLWSRFGEEIYLNWKLNKLDAGGSEGTRDGDEERGSEVQGTSASVHESVQDGGSETDEGPDEGSSDYSDEEDASSEY